MDLPAIKGESFVTKTSEKPTFDPNMPLEWQDPSCWPGESVAVAPGITGSKEGSVSTASLEGMDIVTREAMTVSDDASLSSLSDTTISEMGETGVVSGVVDFKEMSVSLEADTGTVTISPEDKAQEELFLARSSLNVLPCSDYVKAGGKSMLSNIGITMDEATEQDIKSRDDRKFAEFKETEAFKALNPVIPTRVSRNSKMTLGIPMRWRGLFISETIYWINCPT